MKKQIFLGALILSAGAYAFDMKSPSEYSVKGIYNFGKINGYVQIPKGGKNGTTTIGRPTFDELGINHISYPEVQFQAKWTKLAVYGNINYQTFKGNGTIKEDLITHNKKIPAESHISSKHEHISYSLGASYDLYKINNFTVSPLGEFSFYNFKYRYSATTPSGKSISSKRAFNWGQENYGLKISYQGTDKFKMDLTMKAGIPINNLRQYYNIDLMNSYILYNNGTNKLNLLFGMGYEKLEFKDRQDEKQNHINHKITPIYKAGFEFTF